MYWYIERVSDKVSCRRGGLPNMSFAIRLKALRLKSGKSLQDVADALEMSKGHLWDLEMGKSTNPSAELLKKMSTYFRVSLATLAGEEPAANEVNEDLRVMFRQLQDLDPKTLDIVRVILDRNSATPNKSESDKD